MKTREIAEFVQGELVGDAEIEIDSVAGLVNARAGQLAFLEHSSDEIHTNASCVIVPTDFSGNIPHIKTANSKLAFARAAKKLVHSRPSRVSESPTASIHQTADVRASVIGEHASIGENTYIGEYCEIHDGVRIGRDVVIKKYTVLMPNVVVYDGVEIGYDCVIRAGSVLGADGFGYVKDENGNYEQFPQVGGLVIEDNVEIGANTCIDRGSLGETRIGEGTKIDNLVQIAHNVQIGKRVIIAAQTGISGSTVIEDDCVIGGQVGMGDHATVKSGAIIGSQAGVLPGKIVRQGVWWGTPVQPLDEYKRQNALIKGLARLKAEVKELKARLEDRS